jgi:peroxiredoxin
MVEEGSPAPTFTLPSDSGDEVSLESFRGKPVVLYFHPKDDMRTRYRSNWDAPYVVDRGCTS